MFRLRKYFKPYLVLILVSFACLFTQAIAELALPSYMSDIVNVGIQQGGIEDAVPVAVRASQMQKWNLFLSEEEKSAVLADYTLIDSSSPEYEKYVKEYPALSEQPVYVRNEIDAAEIEKLNPITGKAILAVSTIEKAVQDPESAAALSQSSGMDLSQLPAGTDIFAVIEQLPAETLAQMTAKVNGQFSAMGSSMIIQSAASDIKAEYEALGMDAGHLQTNYLIRVGGIMTALALVTAVASILVGFLSSKTAAGAARDIRRDVFSKVESFSKAEFEKFSTASLITRSTNDITQVQNVTMMIMRMVFFAPVMGVGAIILAIRKSPSMSWIIGLAIVLMLILIFTIFKISLPKFKRIQSLIDRLNLVTRERLSGLMVIRAFNTQGFEAERFDKANKDLMDNQLFVNRVMVILMPMMTLIMNGLSILIMWVGAHQIAQSSLQVGDLMAFIQYATHVVFSFLMISMMFIMLPRASVSAGRVADVLEVEPTIVDPKEPKKFDSKTNGLVEFKNVSFRYPDAEENVLCGINFIAKPGETTAIIGSTGSGKSTVVNLIPRFFDVSEGAIFVDGVDIREVKQSDLRAKIGFIPQKGMLFSGTIESNLLYADENAAPELINKAIEISQAHEFVDAKEKGLQTEISQGGMNVSGGQKQRLAIARALVKQAPIYIFDDCLSALDFKTDAALRRALKKETGKSTMIIVTQRVSTIKTAEQIVVLDEGQVVGKGTHSELMKSCETYREIALSQLSKEELA